MSTSHTNEHSHCISSYQCYSTILLYAFDRKSVVNFSELKLFLSDTYSLTFVLWWHYIHQVVIFSLLSTTYEGKRTKIEMVRFFYILKSYTAVLSTPGWPRGQFSSIFWCGCEYLRFRPQFSRALVIIIVSRKKEAHVFGAIKKWFE